MKRRTLLLALTGLIVAGLLAFFLRDVIRQVVVTPLAWLWWLLNLIYSAIPQLFLWILLLVVLVLIAALTFLDWVPSRRKLAASSKPLIGPVETLAGWLSKNSEGNYYKWMVANRLGKLYHSMSEGGEIPDRKPSAAVDRYLRAGLEESFVDYPIPPFRFIRRNPTPFDLEVEQAVEFLESEMEARSGRKRS